MKKEIIKGFDKDFKCRGFQYKSGEIYKENEKKVKICEKGFHFCENPFDVFGYYAPADKEERISIQSFKYNPCENCDGYYYCKKHDIKCVLEKDYNNGITRQEAISKIAIRLEIFLDNLQKNKDKVMPWYTTRDIAEVALNALLEGGK